MMKSKISIGVVDHSICVPAQVKCRCNAVGNHKFHPESQTQLCLAADIDNLLGAIIFYNFFGFNPLNTILATFLLQLVLKLMRRFSYIIVTINQNFPIRMHEPDWSSA